MKINFYPALSGLMSKVTKKSNDQQGGSGQGAFKRHQKKKDENEKEFEEVVSDEIVQNAISAFSQDEMNKVSGIRAEAEGHGPGLKVILKDASGGMLRAVSGEEFLKLLEAATQGQRSGRLLDRKA